MGAPEVSLNRPVAARPRAPRPGQVGRAVAAHNRAPGAWGFGSAYPHPLELEGVEDSKLRCRAPRHRKSAAVQASAGYQTFTFHTFEPQGRACTPSGSIPQSRARVGRALRLERGRALPEGHTHPTTLEPWTLSHPRQVVHAVKADRGVQWERIAGLQRARKVPVWADGARAWRESRSETLIPDRKHLQASRRKTAR